MARTLILAGTLPGNENVGQILLREMLECVDPTDFALASVLEGEEPGSRNFNGMKAEVFRGPKEQADRRSTGLLGSLACAWRRWRLYESDVKNVARRIVEFAQRERVDRVWSILNMTGVIDLTETVTQRLGAPLIAHVWDDAAHLLMQRGVDSVSRRRTMRRFARVLRQAERTAVICEEMGNVYQTLYGARWQVIRHGVCDEVIARESPTSSNEFRIGFSGGMYCPSAWNCLIQSLELLGGRVAGKAIRLVVMGGEMRVRTRRPVCVEYLGWRSLEEVQTRLADCDLLYLPQPFETHQRPLAELSFPTKLSAYVGVGRPILVQAPDYGSLTRFFREHGLDALYNSLNPEGLGAMIRSFAEDPLRYREAAAGVRRIGQTTLSRAAFQRQVREFLDPEGQSYRDGEATERTADVEGFVAWPVTR